MGPFRDRKDAGQQLAALLIAHAGRSDVIVLALPRGGVPVAAEIASALQAPLDLFLVRKLGVPTHPELAMGAIAEGGVKVLSRALIADLDIAERHVEEVAVRERLELDRRAKAFRGQSGAPDVADRVVILVDDGLATGSTMEAAILALRDRKPSRIIVAVPVGAPDTCDRIAKLADELVVLTKPAGFRAVGEWYESFDQMSDAEVVDTIRRAREATAPAAPAAAKSASKPNPAAVVRRLAVPLSGGADQYDAIIEFIGDARLVLIGEASHGTDEFYRHRALITRRLIEDRGFQAVAAEADWPDAYRVNRFARLEGEDKSAVAALGDFRRFPAWMWRNAPVLDFVSWLRTHNSGVPVDRRAGFYGLDLYSLHGSMHAVLRYLRKADPAAAERARRHYACFDRFGAEAQDYAYATGLGLASSCEREVMRELIEMRRRAADYAGRDGYTAADEYFFAEQNARLVRNAEEYYRTMLGDRVESWNLRDRHMAETLRELIAFLDHTQPPAKVVVWAHNSHLGDARATEMGHAGELTLGQLVREDYGESAVLIGMTTHTGTVRAATDWDGPGQCKAVRPSLVGSAERLFHETGVGAFWLALRSQPELADLFDAPVLERAIGVIYRPQTERLSHYFEASLARQFDGVLHVDQTRAVDPLDRLSQRESEDLADTFPTGV
jgi:erythromycin esterase-like protein/predicted phosphoribosyltransferase